MTCLPSDIGLVSPFTGGFLGCGVQPRAAESLLDDIVSRWSLNELATTSRADSVGANTLTDVNEDVTQAAGKLGNAAGFGGAAERLLCAAPAGLPTGALTIQAWVHVDDNLTAAPFLRHGITGGTLAWRLRLLANGSIEFSASSDGTSYDGVVTAGTLSAETWAHIIAWHDPGAGLIGLSVDGGAPVTAAFAAGLSGLAVGLDLGGNNGGSAFRVDELVIWSAVKSEASRAALYNGGAGIAWPY